MTDQPDELGVDWSEFESLSPGLIRQFTIVQTGGGVAILKPKDRFPWTLPGQVGVTHQGLGEMLGQEQLASLMKPALELDCRDGLQAYCRWDETWMELFASTSKSLVDRNWFQRKSRRNKTPWPGVWFSLEAFRNLIKIHEKTVQFKKPAFRESRANSFGSRADARRQPFGHGRLQFPK
jgi:hypothetical protein